MRNGVRLIAVTECVIGLSTILGLFFCPFIQATEKTVLVFYFVLVAAGVSFTIGLGLFFYQEVARKSLVYFSGYIVLEKILIFLGVLTLTGKTIETVMGVSTDIFSIVYHGLIIVLLTRSTAKKLFNHPL